MGGRGAGSGTAILTGAKAENYIRKNLTQEEQTLVFGIPESERKDFYYHTDASNAQAIINSERLDPKKYINSINDAAKYDNVVVNIDLPQLQGSEKQIAWANDIRQKGLSNVVSHLYDKYVTRQTQTQKDNFMQSARNAGKVANTISDTINLKLQMEKKYKLLKTETSAKKIIEDRDYYYYY